MTAAEVQSLTIAQLDEAIFRTASDLSFLRKIRKARQELEETLAGRTNLETLAGKPMETMLPAHVELTRGHPELNPLNRNDSVSGKPIPEHVVAGKASGKP